MRFYGNINKISYRIKSWRFVFFVEYIFFKFFFFFFLCIQFCDDDDELRYSNIRCYSVHLFIRNCNLLIFSFEKHFFSSRKLKSVRMKLYVPGFGFNCKWSCAIENTQQRQNTKLLQIFQRLIEVQMRTFAIREIHANILNYL